MRPCFDPLALSLAAPYLCRWWLCRRKITQGFEAHRRMDDRNHQTFRHGAGLRSSAPQMGRRTYFRMARSLSQTGKGFRSDNRQLRRERLTTQTCICNVRFNAESDRKAGTDRSTNTVTDIIIALLIQSA